MPRPVLFVLAGVNGAGKSSVGGYLIQKRGESWYNPDDFTREAMRDFGLPLEKANEMAWRYGVQLLDDAIRNGTDHAFETTLGGRTIAEKIREAAATHDVSVWYCSLASAEQHVERVRSRVKAGGHDIPVERIYERWQKAPANLISLIPHLKDLAVFDNSAEAPQGQPVPEPLLVLQVVDRHLEVPAPDDAVALEAVPDWAKPIVQAAIEHFAPDREELTPSFS